MSYGRPRRDWRKSSFSGNGGECVEVGQVRDAVAVRDTKDADQQKRL